MTTVMRHKKIPLFAGVSLLLLVSLLMSCSTPTGQKAPAAAAKTEKAEKIRQAGPAPGDVRLENGIEYVYGRNPKFGMGPDEPEHIWLRKEDYSPGRTGSGYVRTDPAAEKERKELLERLEKLEAEVKKQNGNSQ
jgi:hypothetical protein